MRSRLVLTLACALLTAQAGAQTRVRVLNSTIAPARPYVGDIVECSIGFDPGEARLQEGQLAAPAASEANQDIELVAASLRRKSGVWEYSVRFIAWVPGAARVPVAPGAGISFPDVLVDIASAVDDFGRAPPNYKDPLELPGTRLLVWGFSGALLGAAGLAWTLTFGLLPWIRRMRRAWREGRAGRDFESALAYLETSSADLREEERWALLVKALRQYLAARTPFPYQAFTSSEARNADPERLPAGVAAEAAALLSQGDEIRFAHAALQKDPVRAIERSREILRQVEEASRDIL